MINYFENITDQEQAKARFRELAKIYHPDRKGGNTAIMQEITRQYSAFRVVDHDKNNSHTETRSEKEAFIAQLKREITELTGLSEDQQEEIFYTLAGKLNQTLSTKYGIDISDFLNLLK